ncbi:MAG: sodium:proton antiporter [Planctomycetota bacterium]|nr:MAG: sodium:proton antiporter [Planctomycetota bacterium]
MSTALLPGAAQEHLVFEPAVPWVLPFAALLLGIAFLPLFAARWWHPNRNKLLVALACGLPIAGLFVVQGDGASVAHTLHEYTSFLILLAALYTISGGIVLTGDLRATPWVNAAFLLIGAVLASFMGTTGAAMLLVRPLLKTNSERAYKVHTVVFFIFLVCNMGGCLTPLGDPPLFLGYLRGVPFGWTLGLWKEWAFMAGALLALYLVLDHFYYRKEPAPRRIADLQQVQPLRLRGQLNFLWLGGVMAAVALLTFRNLQQWLAVSEFMASFVRDGVLASLGFLAYATTSRQVRRTNEFTWAPILEVAFLFFGIFLSMMAPIRLLQLHGGELGLHTPVQFFWATGALSSFLDNAPTYAVFFATARSVAESAGMTGIVDGTGVPHPLLVAVSLGAVFMGANTYIGNAPNFMVKAIAEESRVKMPSFFGYMGYSIAILIPLFAAVSVLFLRA